MVYFNNNNDNDNNKKKNKKFNYVQLHKTSLQALQIRLTAAIYYSFLRSSSMFLHIFAQYVINTPTPILNCSAAVSCTSAVLRK